MARTTYGAPQLIVHELTAEARPLIAFRIVATSEVESPELLDSLRSHYELSQEPRKVERRSPVLHMGISVFTDPAIPARLAQKWPRLGRYLARLEAGDQTPLNYAETSQRGHLTLWADPVKLRDAIVDIEPIGS